MFSQNLFWDSQSGLTGFHLERGMKSRVLGAFWRPEWFYTVPLLLAMTIKLWNYAWAFKCTSSHVKIRPRSISRAFLGEIMISENFQKLKIFSKIEKSIFETNWFLIKNQLKSIKNQSKISLDSHENKLDASRSLQTCW